jgi:4-amino-4-deoxy-L-arabinose transferase-like glycosyltransferase
LTNVQTLKRAAAPVEPTFERFYLPALGVLCLIVFFYGLGRLPFLGPDEPRYAQVAREMYESGDWITPRLAGQHWFEKPALTYWLAAAGYTLFGVSEFAARCGVALLASGGAWLLYWFGRRVRTARFGYLSAAALVTCGLWPGFARGATFDLPLSVCVELALVCFFVWTQQVKRADRFWWLFCGALGLAVLAKGLVGLVLPVAVATLYALLTGRVRLVLQPRLLLPGALLLLGVVALWYGPMLARHGQEFVDEFIIRHHFQRYTSNKYKHPQPFYFFFLIVLAGSFPWLPFLLASVSRGWRTGRKLVSDPAQQLTLFLWLWVLVPLLFFSFSGSKLPGYILPVFPALALLIGLELERWWTAATEGFLKTSGVALGCLLFAAAAGLRWLGRRELDLTPFEAGALVGVAALVTLVYLTLLLVKSGRAATLFTLWHRGDLIGNGAPAFPGAGAARVIARFVEFS